MMLEARNISKRFGKLRVLDDMSLSIAPSRVTAILGPNAAGKTTLVKIILGLTRQDAGIVKLEGIPVDPDGGYRARIGYMPQIARFPENLTAAELFAMLSDLRGANCPVDDDLIGQFNLSPELDKPLRILSGGTRQKVNAVMAFLFKPTLLILDEPTAGLDPIASGILKDKILAERAGGKTFILTSHIMSELEELADDVAFLNDGRVGFAGAVHALKHVTQQANLERAIAEMMKRGMAA